MRTRGRGKDKAVLRVLCVDSLAVIIEDLYFVDPDPAPGQEGPERGIRVELRLLEQRPRRGSVYASQRIVADKAVWRADFLESVARGPGSKDRMHHHPTMTGNEPGARVFTRSLTEDPMGWLETRLSDTAALLEAADIPDAKAYLPSADALRAALPEIMATARTTLDEVRAGRLAHGPTP
ncbi:MAG: hypothetical protein QOE54_1547 [Streptosporangiaceae bacterium]|nr:hypothetical protein [Streptosporangiaceae bacterium]MDX6429181.1 hypothetical protein [Streptosporangiaceae bacterium]